MPTVIFASAIQRHVPVPDLVVDGASVKAALEAVFDREPKLRSYVLDDQAGLRKHVTVIVDGRSIRDRSGLGDGVSPASEIFVFQALSGG